MSVQNLCFGRLFNKKIDMKYFKNLIIVQMWATSTLYLFFFSFLFPFLIKGRLSFVCFDDREISTSEIVICSLSSHHILTPNELICLTPAAIREGLDGGVWNSLISKNLAHYSLSLKCLLILKK